MPPAALRNIHRALRPDGIFLVVDIKASSKVEENIDLLCGSCLYAISTFHCMSVSLGLDGDGPGTVWGEQFATSMFADAGFANVESQRRGIGSVQRVVHRRKVTRCRLAHIRIAGAMP